MGIKEQLDVLKLWIKKLDESRFLDQSDKRTVRKMKRILNSDAMKIEYIDYKPARYYS